MAPPPVVSCVKSISKYSCARIGGGAKITAPVGESADIKKKNACKENNAHTQNN